MSTVVVVLHIGISAMMMPLTGNLNEVAGALNKKCGRGRSRMSAEQIQIHPTTSTHFLFASLLPAIHYVGCDYAVELTRVPFRPKLSKTFLDTPSGDVPLPARVKTANPTARNRRSSRKNSILSPFEFSDSQSWQLPISARDEKLTESYSRQPGSSVGLCGWDCVGGSTKSRS